MSFPAPYARVGWVNSEYPPQSTRCGLRFSGFWALPIGGSGTVRCMGQSYTVCTRALNRRIHEYRGMRELLRNQAGEGQRRESALHLGLQHLVVHASSVGLDPRPHSRVVPKDFAPMNGAFRASHYGATHHLAKYSGLWQIACRLDGHAWSYLDVSDEFL